jgi:hypothetical protein
MPLAGTKREQKHYRRIREEYPEKGKEYAARVARNIVRANTPGGRELKGTTQYGRTWGPPYSEPLSKNSAYNYGVETACRALGLTKKAAQPLREWLRRALAGPYGEGQLYGDAPGRGAALGALSGGMGGLAVAGAPKLRRAVLRALMR